MVRRLATSVRNLRPLPRVLEWIGGVCACRRLYYFSAEPARGARGILITGISANTTNVKA